MLITCGLVRKVGSFLNLENPCSFECIRGGELRDQRVKMSVGIKFLSAGMTFQSAEIKF